MVGRFALSGLTGREYKMLLDPDRFPDDARQVADSVWEKLPDIFGPHLAEAGGMPRVPAPKKRAIRFHDTDDLALDGEGYSLRLRQKGDDSEVTLKLRTADIFVSGSTSLPEPDDIEDGEEAEGKFEEDIAPLEVQAGDRQVVLSAAAGMRSRFSRSIGREKKKKGAYGIACYADATALFPRLHESLVEAGVELAPEIVLNAGPEIDERVFKTGATGLKDDLEIVLALTLWYLEDPDAGAGRKRLRIVELSFQWDFPEDMPDSAAEMARWRRSSRRAGGLFIAMQEGFRDQIDRASSSKTKLGLPERRR
jgi:hypothetical protein